jgi:hypothetical protein
MPRTAPADGSKSSTEAPIARPHRPHSPTFEESTGQPAATFPRGGMGGPPVWIQKVIQRSEAGDKYSDTDSPEQRNTRPIPTAHEMIPPANADHTGKPASTRKGESANQANCTVIPHCDDPCTARRYRMTTRTPHRPERRTTHHPRRYERPSPRRRGAGQGRRGTGTTRDRDGAAGREPAAVSRRRHALRPQRAHPLAARRPPRTRRRLPPRRSREHDHHQAPPARRTPPLGRRAHSGEDRNGNHESEFTGAIWSTRGITRVAQHPTRQSTGSYLQSTPGEHHATREEFRRNSPLIAPKQAGSRSSDFLGKSDAEVASPQRRPGLSAEP